MTLPHKGVFSADPDQSSPDWTSSATNILLNPWMPQPQRAALLSAMKAMPTLPRHVWLTTSGSSGIKWVALSKDALLASAQAVNEHLQASASDVWALALPVFHVGGLSVLARAFLSGAPVHRYADVEGEPRWNAASFYRFLRSTNATLTTLVPTQLYDLLQDEREAPKALRAVVIGGGSLSRSLYRAARTLGWPVLPSYGLSECCSQVATAPLTSLECEVEPDEPPLSLLTHVEARLSTDGRLMLRSPALLTGYGLLDQKEAGSSGARFVDPKFVDSNHEEWFLTEDLAELQGRTLTFAGRIGDFVKIGGESVNVGRLDRRWDQVRVSAKNFPDTVLFAAPDARRGAAIQLAAAGSRAAQALVSDVVVTFNRQVLPFERIQAIHWMEEIPRSPLGKILRAELLEQAGFRTG